MGAGGRERGDARYGDDSQTAEARADAALVLGLLPREPAGVAALLAGAGKGAAPVRVATMQSLARVYEEAGGGLEKALAEGGDDARVGDLARAIGLAATRFGGKPEAAAALATAWERGKGGDYAVKLRLVRAMGDVGDNKLAGALAEAARDADPIGAHGGGDRGRARAGRRGDGARGRQRDADAGVRKAALSAAGTRPDAVELGTHALASDGWPMVRREARRGAGAGLPRSRRGARDRSSMPSRARARRWPAPIRRRRCGARRWRRSAIAAACRWRRSRACSPEKRQPM